MCYLNCSSHRPLVPPLRGFARDAKDAELLFFSFAVERTAKEKHSQFSCKNRIIYDCLSRNSVSSFAGRSRILAFRPLSGKLKKSPLAFSAALR